ncbi:MAG: 3-oxoacid CoA-transferase subunit B [Alphaproteobacteria bacterium]|nr:3-oxoacid CoA-transferase subunit B [Alphaproteobacteria bacterium]
MTISKEELRQYIVKRVAKEFKDGDVVTLGIGMPTEAANYLPEGVHISVQAENGIVCCGPKPEIGFEDEHITDAGGNNATILPGGAFFDSSMSFTMIRGGHINKTVLGSLQVDENGNLANYLIPGKKVPGMGGAMDLVVGAQEVIVVMDHCVKDGSPKILHKCTLPLTAVGAVDLIITEKCVIKVEPDGLHLREVSPYSSIEDIKATTEADLIIDEDCKILK